jgi:hypothetical protein
LWTAEVPSNPGPGAGPPQIVKLNAELKVFYTDSFFGQRDRRPKEEKFCGFRARRHSAPGPQCAAGEPSNH